MPTYIKCAGLVMLCLLLGIVAIALVPLLTIIGTGVLVLFLGYAVYIAHKTDIDAEVEKLKQKR